MTRDDIIRIAEQAGFGEPCPWGHSKDGRPELHAVVFQEGPITEELERFAKLVEADVREACAKQCEDIYSYRGAFYSGPMCSQTLKTAAAAMRSKAKRLR